jgi:hypothetical protein
MNKDQIIKQEAVAIMLHETEPEPWHTSNETTRNEYRQRAKGILDGLQLIGVSTRSTNKTAAYVRKMITIPATVAYDVFTEQKPTEEAS